MLELIGSLFSAVVGFLPIIRKETGYMQQTVLKETQNK